MTDHSIGCPADETPARAFRPWYHRPEWIIAVVALASALIGGADGLSKGQAETTQNTKDIAELKGTVNAIPERLGRLEQAVHDLDTFERRRKPGE